MTVPSHTFEAFPEFEVGQWESDYEDEFEDEGDFEDEADHEFEADLESEEFFRGLAQLASRAAQNPTLRRIGLTAARHAIRGIPQVAGAIGEPGSGWSKVGRGAGGALSRHLMRQLPECEDEWESDGEFEINPIARVYPAALMEHLGRAAAETEDEDEAEAFIGALVPLAARLIPQIAPVIMRSTPQLVRGAANVTRLLRANPSTRPLVRTMPTILARAARTMANQAAAGRPPTATRAVRVLAGHTARTLSDPRQAVRAYQRSKALDRRYHQAAARCLPSRRRQTL